jgi:hypothetical protein
MIYLPDYKTLKHEVLEEAKKSKLAMYLGSSKMY